LKLYHKLARMVVLLNWSWVTFILLVQTIIFIIAILMFVQVLCMSSVGHNIKVSTALISSSNNINTQCIGNIVTYRHTQFYTLHYLSPSVLKIKVNSADNILSFCILKKKTTSMNCTHFQALHCHIIF